MKKIQTVSRILSLFFRVLCWVMPMVTSYLILFHLSGLLEWGAFALIIPAVHVQDTVHFSFLHRLMILAVQLLPLSITVSICYKLANLFKLYEKGELFAESTIKLIRSISIYMILGEVIQLIYQPLITASLTFNNPPGQRIASITLGSTNVSTLITACIILVASWIIKEANQLKVEAQLTI
ncbi:Protein of uncharacterised function (DUF2975) [Legionella beliardensis]|uniref:Protein of uncharacterized function (DUF2975) n=1 Tax=Legionella beliardensis TaxID=91822 RepID=A0A378I9I5_9GAMM|nr:DUF2975 domain-containing protein [Legionella beliardensis]STX29044.1 Protein of uncharacterised function (DUF2975) [Legionella beliardensis]